MGRDAEGKKRAREESIETPSSREQSSSLSPPPDIQPIQKRSKRAVTRQCPVCEEAIPVRLLGAHLDLELHRVDEILKTAGSSVVFDEAGPSTSRRGAAAKARKSLNPRGDPAMNSIDQVEKTVKLIQRKRKGRHAKLKELIALDDEDRHSMVTGEDATCPICLQVIRGDMEMVEAHVDSCVMNASRIQAESEERERNSRHDVDAWGEIEVNGEVRIRLTDVNGLRGTGFHIRDRNQLDVDEDVDVDGDDEAVFGGAQFTERDILDPSFAVARTDVDESAVVDIDDDDEPGGGRTLRDLVAEGKVVTRRASITDLDGVRAEMEQVMGVGDTDKMEQAIILAKQSGSPTKLITALESKINQLESMRVSSSTSLLCRICLDPYNEPTVSTGCWHTCCRECWLRCLGSTKLCPICKRITGATDLRRIYM